MKNRKTFILYIIFLCFLSYSCGSGGSKDEKEPTESTKIVESKESSVKCNWSYKGGSLAGYYKDAFSIPDARDQIDYMKRIGMNTVALIVTWYQDHQTSIIINRDLERSVSDEGVIDLIKYIHEKGMEVNLKPHVDCQDGIWRGTVEPADVDAWFQSFNEFILYFAEIATENKVEIFTIGTEMASMTRDKNNWPFWHQLVDRIRSELKYQGQVTYAAHEFELLGQEDEGSNKTLNNNSGSGGIQYEREPLDYEFWKEFDFISTTVYYDVGSNKNLIEEVSTITSNWNSWKEKIKYVYDNYLYKNSNQLYLVLGEIGYRSVDYAHYHPYEISGPNGIGLSEEINNEAQSNCYEAIFQALCNSEDGLNFLKGAFWWQFEPKQAFEREYLKENNYYTPIKKPASDILLKYFEGNSNTVPPSRDLLADDGLLKAKLDFLSISNNDEELNRFFEIQGAASIEIAKDNSEYYNDSESSLYVEVANPPEDDRYTQIIYYFPENKDISSYNQIYAMIKCKSVIEHPDRYEFSFVLIDRNDTENLEYWQATNLLNYSTEWHESLFRIVDNGEGNPFKNQGSFYLPDWSGRANGILDLTDIIGFMLKITTLNEDSEQFPDISFWLDHIYLDYSSCEDKLPLVEDFDYEDKRMLNRDWKVTLGDNSIVYDTSLSSNGADNKSLELETSLPALTEAVRWGEITKTFCNTQDWSGYSSILISYRIISDFNRYSGKEISVGIVDKGSENEELWMKSGWYENFNSWEYINIPLIGISNQDDPWDKNLNGFVVPEWSEKQNGILDLNRITKLKLRINTTGDDAENKQFYDMTTIIDRIQLIE
ncbi:exported hypothetical protein [Candidatus Magnetomoraceae bacterium gMMP-15]